jgi:hypothetical protein
VWPPDVYLDLTTDDAHRLQAPRFASLRGRASLDLAKPPTYWAVRPRNRDLPEGGLAYWLAEAQRAAHNTE